MKAIVCGGGTGGHLYPALAIASRLREDGAEILYMGAKDSIEAKLAPNSGFAFSGVDARGLRKRSPRLAGDLLVNFRGSLQAKAVIREFKPNIVIGTGGYAEAPVIKAAQQLKIRTLLHEQNAFPGLANRLLSQNADAVCLTFAAAAPYFPHQERLYLTGLPVRREILTAEREAAYNYFKIPAPERSCFTLLVTGGSLGASSLNKAARAAYPQLLAAGWRVVHICGQDDYFALRQQAPSHPRLVLRPYIKEMENALILADLAVARAGASFLAEASCLGLPLILVPYPYAANDHQRRNAATFAAAGAAVVVGDAELSGPLLAKQAADLAQDEARRGQMSAAARSLAVTDAAERIAALAYLLCDQ